MNYNIIGIDSTYILDQILKSSTDSYSNLKILPDVLAISARRGNLHYTWLFNMNDNMFINWLQSLK